jgi:CubicO group peptidase (beta-lactamase class C family)
MKTPVRIDSTLLALLLSALVSAGVVACDDDETASGGGGAGTGAGGANGEGASGAGGSTTTSGTGGWDARFDPLVAALEDDLAESGAFGVSVAVLEKGEITFAQAFGSKDQAGTQPLTPHTLMQIGSTTKQLTAAAVLQKVESGSLSLDDNPESLLPMLDFALDPTWDDQILVRHLISHQGGFYDYTEWNQLSDDARLASFTYGDFAESIFLMNPPGVFWNYSNPNFSVAGLITEELDTRAWPDIMREDIFVPLGMDRTFLRKSEVEADGDYALSYGIVGVGDNTPGEVSMGQMGDSAWVRPAGLAWTTPSQMATWSKFLMEGDDAVLGEALRSEITSEQVDTGFLAGNMHYGYGMFVWRGYLTNEEVWYPVRVWEHGGNTLSFTNSLTILPDQEFAIVITSSAFGTDFSHSVDVALETLVDLPAPTAAPEYEIDPATFGRHVGTYSDPYNIGDVIITEEGGDLHVSMPELDAAGYDVDPILVPVSSEIFVVFIDGAPLDLTFIPSTPGGDSTYIRNRGFVASRPEQMGLTSRGPAVASRDKIESALRRARIEGLPPSIVRAAVSASRK